MTTVQQHTNPVELQRKAREALLAYRTKEEERFGNWKKALLTCSKEDVLDKLPFDVNTLTFQDLMPELYKDRPDQAQYDVELKSANELINSVNDIIDDLNRQGALLLEEYNKIK